MKKTLIALAALSCASSVMAQSNVTLYGVLDQSVGFTSHVQNGNGTAGSQFGLYPAGGLEGSRWGLRGSEDLGNGLSAFFQVESGMDLGTGRFTENNTLFNRKALVGLRSSTFGSIALGRQADFVSDFVAPHSQIARFARSVGGAPFDLNNFDYTHQLQNAIKYVSPLFGHFYVGGAVSLSGVAGATGQNLVWSLGAGYDHGPFKAGLAYTDSKNAAFNPLLAKLDAPGVRTVLSTAAVPIGNVPATGQSGSRYRVGAIGGSYDFGQASLAATYSLVHSSIDGRAGALAGTAGNTTTFTAHIAELSGTFKVNPTVSLGLGYSYTRLRVRQNGGYAATLQFHGLTAGAAYALSRRTEIYTTAGVQRGSGDTPFSFINGVGPSNVRTQAHVRVGLRHAF
ncbi:porin [Robbsia sp. KACC 23696]|uniref:porin n=1 Tax=Robbsia sp. KACC 23696 TaxID=3149231 RepID=UPI00325B093B